MSDERAVVVIGPRASGKTLYARKFAAERGTFAEVDGKHLSDPFRMGEVLITQPASLIVEGVDLEAAQHVRALLAGPTTVAHRKGQRDEVVRTPFLFLTSNDFLVGRALETVRGVRVVELVL